MKRLIIVTKKWGRNFTGATLATQYFVERWIEHFDCVSVYTLQYGEAIEHQHLKVFKFKNEYALMKSINKDALDIKATKQYVCYSDDHLGFVFSIAGLSYIHTYHGNWPEAKYISFEFYLKSFYFIPLYVWTIKKAKVVVNVSEYMRRFTLKYNQNSVVIRNGIERKTVCDGGVKDNCFLIVGNIDQRKYGYAIKVLENLQCMDSKVHIDIYGSILDRKIEKKIRALHNVCLCGSVKDIPYKKYLGLINTSRMENLSISVCEAIMNGIPVFSFDVGGLPEVIRTGKTGYVIPAYDTAEMARHINDYFISASRMNVDKTVLDEFSWEIAAKKYLALFS